MKEKKIVFLAIMVVMLLLFGYGCCFDKQSYNTDSKINAEISSLNADEEGIIFISEGNSFPLDLESITLNIINNLQDYYIDHGLGNRVQVYEGGTWLDIPLHIYIDSIGLSIKPNESGKVECYLQPTPYQYAEGKKYRILHEIEIDDKKYNICIKFQFHK